MRSHYVLCVVIVGATLSSACGQESLTRTFPEAGCSYTLPASDWQWLDPETLQMRGGKTIAIAHNPAGLRFVIRFNPLEPGERSDPAAFESFEVGVLQSTKLQKVGGTHITFLGSACYQMHFRSPNGQETLFRILHGNGNHFQLQLANPAGALAPDRNTNLIFEGFQLSQRPGATRSAETNPNFERGRDSPVFLLVCVGVVGGAACLGLVWYLIRHHRRNDGHIEP